MYIIQRSLMSLLLVALLQQAHAGDVLATVNGKPISKAAVEAQLASSKTQGASVDENARKDLIDNFIMLEVLAQEAQRVKFDKQADYVKAEEQLKRQYLASSYFNSLAIKVTVSEAETKAAYDRYKAELAGKKEYNAQHILVATQNEANDIVKQLKSGGDFAALAKEKSKDAGSKDTGGDLDWFATDVMVKPFAEAVASLQKGTISEPVQTQYGWHVIKLVDIRDTQALPPYEKVRDGLEKQLKQEQVDKILADLRAKAKIQYEGAEGAK